MSGSRTHTSQRRVGHRIIALLFAIALGASGAAAGPFSFLFFWRKSPPKVPLKDSKPGQTAEIADLLSVPAKQKCENWAWAAALETALKAQHAEIPQNYWVMKADGGEL